jgi:hypothetical protein
MTGLGHSQTDGLNAAAVVLPQCPETGRKFRRVWTCALMS